MWERGRVYIKVKNHLLLYISQIYIFLLIICNFYMFLTFVLVYVSVFACLSVYKCIVVHVSVWAQMRGCTVICELWSFKCLFMRFPNDEGSQFSKFHFPCSKGERWTLYSFFRECKVYSKTYQPAKNSLSCSQLFVTSLN